MPRVSYVIPAIRNDEWLSLAIRSVQLDPYQDKEIVVVSNGDVSFTRDDLSPTLDVDACRLSVIRSNQKGVANALNAGIDAVDCEFIARLDADDVSEPGRTARQVDFLTRHPTTFGVGGCAFLVNSLGEKTGLLRVPAIKSNIEMRKTLRFDNPYIHPSMMMRAAELKALKYDVSMIKCQDWELWARVAESGGLIENIQEPLISYRRHGGQESISSLSSIELDAYSRCVRSNMQLVRGKNDILYQRTSLLEGGKIGIIKALAVFSIEIVNVPNTYALKKLVANLVRAVRG